MKTLFKSTTSLGMSLMLILPNGAFAQGDVPACDLSGEDVTFPCMFDAQAVNSADELAVLRAQSRDPSGATGTGLDVVNQAQQAQQAEDAQTAAEQQAAEEQAAEDAQAAAEQQAAEEQAAEDAQAAAEEQAAEDAQAAAEQQAAEEQGAEDAQAAAEQQAAEEQAAEDAQAAAEEQAAEEQAAEDAQAAAEQQAAEEQAVEDAQAAAEQQAAEEQAAEDAQATAEAQAEADRQAAELEAQRQEERRLERESIAAAAAAADAENSDAEVVTEEITEENVRSSDEEFATGVTGDQAADQAAAAAESDDGLSSFEKALLVGLGAVVVGSVLKNGDKVVSRSGDRVVVEDPSGDLRVLKDEDALIRQAGDEVQTQTFDDGSSRSIVTKPDGSQIITIRARDRSVLRRVSVDAQGNQVVLFDDLVEEQAVAVNELPEVNQQVEMVSTQNEQALRAALQRELATDTDRRFSLRQVREIGQVRALAPQLELDAVRFETGSAAIQPEQARSLARIGTALRDQITQDPRTVILVEGHTDAVGSATYNLALSDRRAETVALALTEYFEVPAQNLITQGYGESDLKVSTVDAEPANRRAVVRNITGLLR